MYERISNMEILEYIERWKFDWIIYLKWNGVESLQSRNPPILKSFSFINHSTFRLALGGNRKYFHVPFFSLWKNFTLYFPNAFFTAAIYYLHSIDFICHSTRKNPFRSFLTQKRWMDDVLEATPSKNESFLQELQLEVEQY